MSPEVPPLIVTATLDEGAFAWFDDLRRQHFPPHRNIVPAHLTLFHALPGVREAEVRRVLAASCARRGPFPMAVRGPWSLGRGVAYRLGSAELAALRAELADSFAPWLTRQDQAGFRPHVTVQNKVEPGEARDLLERLQAEFEPFDVFAEGLSLWRYLGGPWSLVERFGFGEGETE